MEYDAGLLKAAPKPRSKRKVSKDQNALELPMPAVARLQIKQPRAMMSLRLCESAARPMKRPVGRQWAYH